MDDSTNPNGWFYSSCDCGGSLTPRLGTVPTPGEKNPLWIGDYRGIQGGNILPYISIIYIYAGFLNHGGTPSYHPSHGRKTKNTWYCNNLFLTTEDSPINSEPPCWDDPVSPILNMIGDLPITIHHPKKQTHPISMVPKNGGNSYIHHGFVEGKGWFPWYSHNIPMIFLGFSQLQDAFLGLSDGSLSLSIHTPGQAGEICRL